MTTDAPGEKLMAENAALRKALLAFVKHFGPIEDNIMLDSGCRRCFKLARKALRRAGR